jgi:adhesin transport system outer membrane protein
MRVFFKVFISLIMVNWVAVAVGNPLRVEVNSGSVNLDLDRFSEEAITGAGRPFDELKREINQLFFSVPSVLRLVAIQSSLDAQVDQVASAKEFQFELSVDGGGRTGSSNDDGQINSQSITGSKLLYDFGAIDSRIKQARLGTDASRAELENLRSENLLSLVLANINVNAQSRLVKLASSFYETRVKFQKLIEEKRDLGALSDADVIRAEAKTYEAEAGVPTAYMGLQDALDRYEELFGRPSSTDDWYEIPSLDLEKIISGQVDDHSTVMQAQAEFSSAVAELDAFRSGDNGSLSFQVIAARTDGEGSNSGERFDAKVVYQRTLGDGGSRDATEVILRAKVKEYEAELQRAKRERIRIISNARNALSAAEGSLLAQKRVLLASRKANEATKELYLYNRGSIADVFKAEEDYVSAIRGYIDAKRSVQTNFYELLHEAGALAPQFELGI